MAARGAPDSVAWLLAGALLAACTGDGGEADAGSSDAATHTSPDDAGIAAYDAGRGWSCAENAAMCACTLVPIAGLRQACAQSWPCCLSTSDACTCIRTDDCTSAAASMDASVVSHCPPGAKPMVTCAAEGQNCTRAALQMQMLSGCCEGLVCKPYSPDVRLCRNASPDELALAAQCNAPAPEPAGAQDELTLDTPPTSNRGTLPFDRVTASVQVGPGGCMTSVDLTLAQADHAHCSLTVHAGPEADARGALVLARSAVLDARDCSGLPQAARLRYETSALAGTLAFEGLSCEAGPVAELWCAAGGLELELTGAFADGSGTPPIDEDAGDAEALAFDAAVVQLHGRVCGSMQASACPEP